MRKRWKQYKRQRKEKASAETAQQPITPPSTPPQQTPPTRGKARNRYRLKLARQVLELKREVEKLKRSNEKYRKRANRADSKLHLTPNKTNLTPCSKARQVTNECFRSGSITKAKKQVTTNLLKYFTLTEGLSLKYKHSNNQSKKTLKSVICSKILKKYKCQRKVGLDGLRLKGRPTLIASKRDSEKHINIIKKKQNIVAFYLRDDVSRATAGKKETRTLKKDKKQKRYLLDTLKNLYKKYKEEGGNASYTQFTRQRPFYVVMPSAKDRDTCLCIYHSNINHKATELHKLGVISTSNTEELIDEIVCSKKSKICMYSECKKCNIKEITSNINTVNKLATVEWYEWVKKREDIQKEGSDGQIKLVKKTKNSERIKNWNY